MSAVSVVMPVYNCRPYLAECLTSVLSQTLADLEVLCIDDGSTDGSAEILAAYAAKDPRVRVFSQTNAGAAAARNLGLAKATGDYVAFMDADDRYPTRDVLERLYREAESHHAKMCGGGMQQLLPDGSVVCPADCPWMDSFAAPGFVDVRGYRHVFGFTRFLYAREIIVGKGISFPAYRFFEDPVFFVRALAASGRFYGVDFPTYVYRVDYRPKRRSPEKVRDHLRGLCDAVRTAQAAGLDGVLDVLWTNCNGQELKTVVGRGHLADGEAFRLLCELDLLFRDRPPLSILTDVRRRADAFRNPAAWAVASARLAFAAVKREIGRFVPDGWKFWRRTPMDFCITFDDGLLAQAKVAAPLLEKFGWRGVFTVPTEILTNRRLTPQQAEDLCLVGNEDKLMTWDDVRTLLAHGHTVVPHTCTHADLPTLFRAGRTAEIEREIADAKEQLTAQTGVVPKFFCLPHSQHNPWVDACVRRHGMEPMNGGGCWRPNVGEYGSDGESHSDISAFIRHCYGLGYPHLDVVAHGIVRAEGGWRPFEDAAAFERFCRDVQAEVDAGRIRVVDYASSHRYLPRARRFWLAVDWLRLKLRQYAFRFMV